MIQKSKGILIVLSGFSGSGKGTIMKELMKKYSEQYALSISATTRSPRPGETDGVEYFFKTKEQFEKMIADDELIEYAKYVDNYYGTPKAYVEEQLAAGKDVILEIEIQGAGDQGMMFGYATTETENYMPVSLDLAQLIMRVQISARRAR